MTDYLFMVADESAVEHLDMAANEKVAYHLIKVGNECAADQLDLRCGLRWGEQKMVQQYDSIGELMATKEDSAHQDVHCFQFKKM